VNSNNFKLSSGLYCRVILWSETLVSYHNTTESHYREDHDLKRHRRKIPKIRNNISVTVEGQRISRLE